MAKKKSKKKGGKRYGKGDSFSGAAHRARAARTPRSETLPGMDQVRDKKLDNLCEGIGDVRETLNEARDEEKSLIDAALRRMVEREIQIYKHAGVELARVPGQGEKLRVRITSDKGDASVASTPEPEVTDEGGDAEAMTPPAEIH